MSVRLVCAICRHELIKVGVTGQLRCPLHGSRGVQEAPSPSKPALKSPTYDFGSS